MAERAGLRPGDTILEVNGTPFRAVTHEEALKVSPTFLIAVHLESLANQLLNAVHDIFYSSSSEGLISLDNAVNF